ncbi:MAG: hypothetical protein IPN69_08540 [Acidobacteria bacterium]|nr:hypothetical protein [Acidobacteriota bacterium]
MATPVFDATHSDLEGSSATSITSASWTVAGSNRFMLAFPASGDDPVADPSGAKWGGSGGTALTKQGSTVNAGSFGKLSLYTLVAPAAASQTSYYSWGSTEGELAGGAISLTGVDQGTPIGTPATATGNFVSGTQPSLSVSCAVGDLIVGACWFVDQTATSDRTVLAGSGSTERYTMEHSGNFEAMCIVTKTATSTSETINFTINGTNTNQLDWAVIGVAVKGASGGGSATTTVESASYTHTPQDVGAKAGFSVTADSASFAFSPQNIGTAKGGAASMLAAQASFAFTPQNVGTSRTRTVDVTYLPVPGNEGYRIEWDSNSGAPYANSAEVATDVLTYAITGLADRTTYYWRVAALVAGVPQSWATEEVFTTGIEPLAAESASYAFTPQSVGTRSAAISTIVSASFAFTPQDIGTSKGTGNIAITIAYAGYTFTPQNVATRAGYLVAANSASYAWTPQSVGTSSTGQEHQFSGAWRVGSYRRRHGR